MELILDQLDEATRAEITLGESPDDKLSSYL